MGFEKIINQPQHHAYLIFADLPEHITSREKDNLYVIRSEKRIGVEDIRWLHDYAFQSVGHDTRRVVISASGITHQAQNALLKIVEDVQKGVYFFICLPVGTEVLDTLLSRCYITDITETDITKLSSDFKEFINASPKDRLKIIDDIWEEGENTRHVTILHMLQNLEKYVHNRIADTTDTKDDSLIQCRKVAESLRDAIYHGALHKGTLHILAFI